MCLVEGRRSTPARSATGESSMSAEQRRMPVQLLALGTARTVSPPEKAPRPPTARFRDFRPTMSTTTWPSRPPAGMERGETPGSVARPLGFRRTSVPADRRYSGGAACGSCGGPRRTLRARPGTGAARRGPPFTRLRGSWLPGDLPPQTSGSGRTAGGSLATRHRTDHIDALGAVAVADRGKRDSSTPSGSGYTCG